MRCRWLDDAAMAPAAGTPRLRASNSGNLGRQQRAGRYPEALRRRRPRSGARPNLCKTGSCNQSPGGQLSGVHSTQGVPRMTTQNQYNPTQKPGQQNQNLGQKPGQQQQGGGQKPGQQQQDPN